MATMISKTSRTRKQTGSDRANKERASLKKFNLLGADGYRYVRKPLKHAPSIAMEVSEPDEHGQIYIEVYGDLTYTKADGTEDTKEITVSFNLDPKTSVLDFGEWNG
jgi:hypothetical protein